MWQRARRSAPCPICGRDHYCTFNKECGLVRCTRAESQKASTASDGGIAWIHSIDGESIKVPEKSSEPVIKLSVPEIQLLSDDCKLHRSAQAKRESLADSLCVSPWSLWELDVGIGWSESGQEYSTWPSRDASNRIVGITRRFESGRKLCVRGTSNRGLFIPSHANARYWRSVKVLWVVEGGSDVAAAVSYGVPAVGRPSNSGGSVLLAQWIPRFCPSVLKIIVWGENDFRQPCSLNCAGPHCHACFPGLHGAEHVAWDLGRRLKIPVVQRMPWSGAKDVREMLSFNSLRGMPCHECRIYPQNR
jgi:hypothetical protein